MRLFRFALLFFAFSAVVFAQNSADNFQRIGDFYISSGEKIIAYDFSDDNSKIRLIGSQSVQIWDIKGNKMLDSKKHGIENLIPQNFGGISPDKTKLLVLRVKNKDDKSITPAKVYDIATGKLLAVLDKTANPVESAIWSKDGSTLVTADNSLFVSSPYFHKSETEIGFYDGKTLEFNDSVNIPDIDWFFLSNNGENFYSTSTPQKKVLFLSVNGMTDMINIRNARTAKDEKNLSVGDENFHTYPTKMMASPDGKYLALVSKNKETDTEHRIMVWKVGAGKTPIYTIPANPKIKESKLSYSSDGKYFAVDSGKDTQIYELETGNLISELKDINPPSFWINNSQILLYDLSSAVRAVNVSSGATVYQNPLRYIVETDETPSLTKDVFGNYQTETTSTIIDSTSIVPSPNGEMFLTYSYTSLDVFDAASGKNLQNLRESPPIREKKVKIFGITFGKEKVYPEATIYSANWSENSKMVVLKDVRQDTLTIWEIKK